jgi:hypothetical protein
MKEGDGKGAAPCGNFARGPEVRDFYWGNLKNLETVISPYRDPVGETRRGLVYRGP